MDSSSTADAAATFDPAQALARLTGVGTGRLLHVEDLPARSEQLVDWPTWVNPQVAAALRGSGLTRLWSHQREAADLAYEGEHVIVSTGTASGKSLAYLLPILSAASDGTTAASGRGATALYLSPTKALAADQLARIGGWAVPGVRAATYDGDTAADERRWIRDHAQIVLTNPDLLHHSLLPNHERWAPFLRSLRYVVVDECHTYRGVFGAHLAAVLRRLRRVAARYQSNPTFVLASATVADPAAHASTLVGEPVRPVTRDGSPRAAMTFGLWEPGPPPGSGPDEGRRSAVAESADLLTALVGSGIQTLAFAKSRVGVEVIADMTRSRLASSEPGLEGSVAAYRGGYLPEERRELERSLRSGALRGLAATNALELGIDVSGLDAVVLAGWPGTVGSLWQQAGRAGRSGQRSLVLLVAADDPLDTYLVHHPAQLFGRPVEASVVDAENPHVLAPHLAAAAAELPVVPADEVYFGPTMRPLLDSLVERQILRRRPRGWFWARHDRPGDHVSLRGTGDPVVRIVENRTGRVLGTVDAERSHRAAHTGAVYVHQGQTYVVSDLDLTDGSAHVTAGDPGWSTVARSVSAFDIVASERRTSWGPVEVHFGTLDVRTQVTSFLRRLPSGEVLGEHPLDLPEQRLRTRGAWWTVEPSALLEVVAERDLPGALHAAEHASIGMLPLVAQSDRWDIGGVSTAVHPDTGLPTVVVYDGYPGGAGFAERGYERVSTWLRATRDAIAGCACTTGCPSCVQSPKCGNGNQPLDKAGAVAVLDVVLRGAVDPADRSRI
ncbi:DEAD/DEAH box helicase [Luteipulveratus flavus]|uniref:DEAD/DEAH box helicase n=1 Tax=Luteipulveratus flavus TaxID=3031728 RepID=A0ABT6C761_9MICO|nr:DEAD/DEAH box helicase [Luteipulveratus sp. YIM 133296]MDF8264781.1 DEAD/DEAH box helicase [Luteipulveratus sp. YIM 133296]